MFRDAASKMQIAGTRRTGFKYFQAHYCIYFYTALL